MQIIVQGFLGPLLIVQGYGASAPSPPVVPTAHREWKMRGCILGKKEKK